MVLVALLAVVVAGIVVVARRGTHLGPAEPPPPPTEADDLDRWCRAGLLTPDQASAIARFEADRRAAAPALARPARGRVGRASRVPVVAESLGYLGGVLTGVGVVLVVAHYWNELFTLGQLVLTGGASAAMLGIGALAGRSEDPAFIRMRAFVWAASSAAAATFGVVVVRQLLGAEDDALVVLAAALATAVHSGLLWRLRDRPVQQAIALAAVVVAVGAGTAALTSEGWWGVAVWSGGAALVGVALRRRGPVPPLTGGIGAIALLVGAVTVASTWPSGGNLFLVATSLGLAAAAFVPVPLTGADRWILGSIGVLACAFSVPGTISWYAQGAGAATGGVVWLAGAALLALGLAGAVHAPRVSQGVGSATMLVGAAVVGTQLPSLAPALGLVTAVGLLAIGARPGAVLESLAGALGLLVFVPWAVGRWFPGESRAPILLVVSGIVILGVAVLVGRMAGRVRRELRPSG